METRQEQIEEIQEIIGDNYEFDSINAALGSGDGDINIEEAAKAIVEAGYGDVSEYKKVINGNFDIIEVLKNTIKERDAEIERLKNANSELVDNLVFYKDKSYKLERSVDKLETEIEQEVKQTRIDVLNELKKKTHNYYPSIDSYCMSQHVVLVRDIDELIKEIENDRV